jgi:hypothetical protein
MEGSEGSEYSPVKLFAVTMPSYGEYKISAASFHTTEPELHLLFLDEDGEVCARFAEWSSVMEIKVSK